MNLRSTAPGSIVTYGMGVTRYAVVLSDQEAVTGGNISAEGYEGTFSIPAAAYTNAFLTDATITLTAPASAYRLLSEATAADCGMVVCAGGHLHDAKTAVPTGCTAVGILGKVTTGHGLILALQDATNQNWNTINGWTSETSYAGTTLKVLPDDAARGTNLTSYTTLGGTTVSNWAVAQKSDYIAIFTNLGSTNLRKSYDSNVNAYITTGVGGTAMSQNYLSATESESDDREAWIVLPGDWREEKKTKSYKVRPVLGF